MIKSIRKRFRIFKASFKKLKVGFIVAGVQKGGTSALDSYLRLHPEICMADKKEVHFFDDEKIFSSKSVKYAYYHSYFSPNSHHRIIGESTPIYMYWNNVPERIHKYNPEMKIIIILRNPVERAFSHWNMERNRNVENLSFSDAIHQEQERCRSALPLQHKVFSYVDRGFYALQLKRILEYFKVEQTLILKNEELRNYPNETLEKVTNFLEINKFGTVESKNVHSRPYNSSITTEEKEYLVNIYEKEIKNLEKMTGWNCSDWLL